MKKILITNILLILMLILGTTGVLAENRNNNPLLREILIDGKEMEKPFDQFITDYVLATDKEKITIEAITDDPNAKTQIIGSTNLKSGNNDIEIKVTAEDGITTQSYFLHITKGDVQKANANLKNIEIKGCTLNPNFNQTDIEYLVTYEGNIEKLDIIATPESDNAKVEILNNSNFSSTYHIVTIKVTAENGITTKEYKIRAKNITDGDHKDEEESYNEEEKNESTNNILTAEDNYIQKNVNESFKQESNMWIYITIIGVVIIIVIAYSFIKRKNGKN